MCLKKVVACIKSHKQFLITAHTNLEGDALGAELAFWHLLKAMNKRATIVNVDNLPYGYEFLPGINTIKKFSRLWRDPATAEKGNFRETKFDCLVILDCSDLARCGEVSQINLNNKTILNIDHHISNRRFGDINWVEPHVSSTSEMIYKLYKKLGIPFNKDIATLLYTGILADTGSFRYSNTSSLTHKIASELIKYDLDVVKIYKQVYENIPVSDMELLIKILPTLRRDASGKIIWFQIKRNMLKNKRLSFDLSEHILSFGRAIKDMEVCVLFKENLGVKNEVRINFRSHGLVDVNKIAQFFGGGGHKTASGATVKGKIDQVRKKVLAKICESLK